MTRYEGKLNTGFKVWVQSFKEYAGARAKWQWGCEVKDKAVIERLGSKHVLLGWAFTMQDAQESLEKYYFQEIKLHKVKSDENGKVFDAVSVRN